MNHKQMRPTIVSLAEELSRISHAHPPIAEDDEDKQQLHETMTLGFLFRMIPDLCSYHIDGLLKLVYALGGDPRP